LYNDALCKKLGGKHCQTPFHDSLFCQRDVLAPNEVFGTCNCYSGYKGLVDGDDMFASCHLIIYKPSFFVRYTVAIVTLLILSGICVCLLLIALWMQVMRQYRSRRQQRQQTKPVLDTKDKTVGAFSYDKKIKRK
jgi:hypothetical protein